MRFAKGHVPKHKHKWNCIYDLFLRKHGADLRVSTLMLLLGRPQSSIEGRLKELGITKVPITAYDDRVKAFVQAHINTHTNIEIAEMLNKEFPHPITKFRANILSRYFVKWGIKRDAKVAKAFTSNYSKQYWAEGKMQNCANSNADKIGTIKLRKRTGRESFLKIKTESGWKILHIANWEREHGPIPKGYALKFKDGNRLNCKIENLELVEKLKLAHEATASLSDRYIVGRLLSGEKSHKMKSEIMEDVLKNRPDIIELSRISIKILKNGE